jgi:hypothetical protein
MAREQIRAASKTLGPLLRRRGTSPAVGSALRRTVQALDEALAAPEGQESPEEIRQALAELRGCLVLIHESTRPADQAQLEGTAKALSFLAPLESALPQPQADQAASQPVAAQGPSVFQTVVPSSLPPPQATPTPSPPRHARAERKRRPLAVQTLDVGAVGVQLAGLRDCFATLHAVLHGAAHRLSDLDRFADALHSHLLAIDWLGRDRVPAFVKASREAKEPEDRLVASAALVHLQAPDGAERSMTVLERAAHAAPLAPVALTILRTLVGQHFVDCMRTVFEKTKSDVVRAVLLPLLVERGQLAPEQLILLVEHPHDAIAVEATLALARVGQTQHAATLATLASHAKHPRRSNALLFAAVALGWVPALAEVRALVRKREDFDEQLVDALAIAGDDSDAALLVEVAAHPDADAGTVLSAAANLGCVATVLALPAFVDSVPKPVREEASRLILGAGQDVLSDPKARDPSVRLLHGQPWSVAGLLARLAAADETVRSQRRLALELRVRTGLAPPAALPIFAPPQARSQALAQWTEHYTKASVRLPAGRWYYQGKPAKLARKEDA